MSGCVKKREKNIELSYLRSFSWPATQTLSKFSPFGLSTSMKITILDEKYSLLLRKRWKREKQRVFVYFPFFYTSPRCSPTNSNKIVNAHNGYKTAMSLIILYSPVCSLRRFPRQEQDIPTSVCSLHKLCTDCNLHTAHRFFCEPCSSINHKSKTHLCHSEHISAALPSAHSNEVSI